MEKKAKKSEGTLGEEREPAEGGGGDDMRGQRGRGHEVRVQ